MRLADYYEMAGVAEEEINQDTSVSLADQYNVAEESDEVINNNNEPDENVPATNNELQVRTATFTTDGGPHVEE